MDATGAIAPGRRHYAYRKTGRRRIDLRDMRPLASPTVSSGSGRLPLRALIAVDSPTVAPIVLHEAEVDRHPAHCASHDPAPPPDGSADDRQLPPLHRCVVLAPMRGGRGAAAGRPPLRPVVTRRVVVIADLVVATETGIVRLRTPRAASIHIRSPLDGGRASGDGRLESSRTRSPGTPRSARRWRTRCGFPCCGGRFDCFVRAAT